MQAVFFNLVGVSITISIVVILLLLLSSYLNERYAVKWRYFIWLILAIRLVIPVDFGLTAPPLELRFDDRNIVYSLEENPISIQTASEPGELEKKESLEVQQNSDDYAISDLVSVIYLTGIAAFLLWQLGKYLSFRYATRRWYRNAENDQILEIFENLKVGMGIEKTFRIKVCRKILSPMIVGLFRPTLLLPHEGYQKIDLEVILKHELVHFKRNDLWFKLLLICANALHWFNPFIYIMVGEANRDIEISCDQEVLKGADLPLRKRYSERILELMQGNHYQEAPISTNFHGGKGMMKSRIQHIFDERLKRKGVPAFLIILSVIIIFSACQFDIGQNKWKIPISVNMADVYGLDNSGNRSAGMSDVTIILPFDLDENGSKETEFSLLVSDEGKTCYLKYKEADGKSVQTQVFNGVEPGVVYSLHAANLEDANSIMFITAIDYQGMPFGSWYWELYSWKDGSFEKVDTRLPEENLQMKILEPAEIQNNAMNAGVAAYLYDNAKYPADYPAAALYFKESYRKDGKLNDIAYAPMSEYDVEGYNNWGQDAINKRMTSMNFVSGENVKGWTDPARALLETEEVVFITLPNITATVKRYYQYQGGEWSSIDGYIE